MANSQHENFLFRTEHAWKFFRFVTPLYTLSFVLTVYALLNTGNRTPIQTQLEVIQAFFWYVIILLCLGAGYIGRPPKHAGSFFLFSKHVVESAKKYWWAFFVVWLTLQPVDLAWGHQQELLSLRVLSLFFRGLLFAGAGPFALRDFLRVLGVSWRSLEWFCGMIAAIGQSIRSMSDAKTFGVAVAVVVILGMMQIAGIQFPRNNVVGPVALLFSMFAFIFFVGMVLLQQRETETAKAELRTAHDMQMGLMPEEDPIVRGFDISGICLPANDVGGDFFDYVWLDRKRTKLGIAVADVSGKAMKAAITAVMTSGMIYREAGGNQSPKTILRNMNRPMYTKLDSRMFTALSFAVIDTRKKELRFSNAGQSYPLLKRGKEVRSLEVKGARLPLGVKEDVTYEEMAVKLKKGDTLIFYTDGIPEAKDAKDEFYGFERLKSLMENLGGLLAKEMRDRILSEVKSFTGNAPQHDDMTVVVVRVN